MEYPTHRGANEEKIAQTLIEASEAVASAHDAVAIFTALLAYAAAPYTRASLAFIQSSADREHIHLLAEADSRGIRASVEQRSWTDYPAYRSLAAKEIVFIESEDDRSADHLNAADRAQMRRRGVGSLLLVPLIANGEVMGVFEIGAADPLEIDGLRLRGLRHLAANAALALYNAVLAREARRSAAALTQQMRSLQTLNRLAVSLDAFADEKALYDFAVEAIVTTLEVDHGGLMLIEGEDAPIGEVVSEYPLTGAVGVKLPMTNNPLFQMVVADLSRPTIVNDAFNNPNVTPETLEVFKAIGIKSIMMVPLIINGHLAGSLGLDLYTTDKIYTPEQAEFAQTLVAQVAIAVENIRLITETRRRADQLQRIAENEALINAITAQLQRTTDISAMLTTAVSELGKALNARRARVRLATESAAKPTAAVNGANGHHGAAAES